ncbi:MAG: hypothetical protein EOO77_18605 [Oxalobacteraceae bacterium]|nr:MAG: hypothetical protein EOO77_18605 [Oxalobacteraceae bacterium]
MFFLLALASATVGVAPRCDGLLPDTVEKHQSRTVSPVDLATLRDIGRPDDSLYDSDPISVSPDGKRIAFQVRRADPARNSYCIGMVVMDLAAGSHPRLIDLNSEPVTGTADIRGNVDVPQGTMTVITPYWSADGRSFSYLRREGGSTQVWRAALDGSPSRQVTRLPVDVEKLDRSVDGNH